VIYRLSDAYYVRALNLQDLEGPYPGWFEDQDVCRYNSHATFFKTPADFREYVASAGKEDRVVWGVCHVTDGHVGNVALQDVSVVNRTAEFAVMIGDKRHWGKGVASLAGRKLIEHGFVKLNLERVYCGTAATNDAMNRLAQTLGMSLEGTRRAHLWLDGHRVDVHDYGILRAEFERNR